VPTWNYVSVHAYGVPVLVEDPGRVSALLRETVAKYETPLPNPWSGDLPEAYRTKLMQQIVAFEILITRLEGKFKLGQNRSAEDMRSVLEELSASSDADGRALAQITQAECSSGGIAMNKLR
jgi:transcriptional regulator